MNESRRDALKKLGLTTGAVWAAPAVTSLVVPRHASATSTANVFDGTLELYPVGEVFSNLLITSETVEAESVSLVGGDITYRGSALFGGTVLWQFGFQVTVDETYVVNINGTEYSVKATENTGEG
jgi:hypothetical protein